MLDYKQKKGNQKDNELGENGVQMFWENVAKIL